MKKILMSALVLLTIALNYSCGTRQQQTASYGVIPKPMSVELAQNGKEFLLDKHTVITYTEGNQELENNANYLKEHLMKLTGLDLKISNGDQDKNVIALTAAADMENPEGYILNVKDNEITINGATPAGNFYGIQTLLKSIPEAKMGDVKFPEVTITDQPRFAYRGAMLDVARHFFPADSVKSFIDMMALHNINTFHWHLTDDQGWRVEIKGLPELIEKGSKRACTVIGHNSGEYDSIPVEGYYTQDEIKDIVDYAAKRYITVIPEIDLPGHMQAALNAYPELGCFNEQYEVWPMWGVSENVLCAGSEKTYKFLEEVLGEVADLFPSELIHIGGDECPKDHWEKCEICQLKIKELGLKTDKTGTKEEKLQSHVMKHMADFLKTKGKRVIGWDEILEGGITGDAIVMSWRGTDGAIEAVKLGHDAIMVPTDYLYFDYYQTLDKENEPDAIGGYVPVEKVYSFNPVPEELTPEEAKHILGLQSNLWTEYISTFDYAQYMELPRMAALSEVQWSAAPKDYDNFVSRLPQMFNHYNANGYRYATHVYDIIGTSSTDADGKNVVYSLVAAGQNPIHYTLDGSEPTEESPVYESPLKIDKKSKIRATTFRNGEKLSTFVDSVSVNKATWKNIKLETAPNPRYSEGAPYILVDGCYGPNAVTAGSWLGFDSENAVAVIDLGAQEEVSSVTVRALTVTGQWIFDTRGIKVALSDNGQTWRQVAEQAYPALEKDTNKVITHKVEFNPEKAQYVKVTIDTEKSMPEWHPAAGQQGFVFIDEIEVD